MHMSSKRTPFGRTGIARDTYLHLYMPAIEADLETLTRANTVARIIRDNPQMDALERRCHDSQ